MPVLPARYATLRQKPRRRKKRVAWFRLNWRGNRSLIKQLLVWSLVLLAGVMLWWLYQTMTPTKFFCRTQYGDCPPEMKQWISLYQDKFFLVAWWQIKHDLPSEFRQIKQIAVLPEWNRELTITLVTDNPVVTISSARLSGEGLYFTVSHEGVLLERTNRLVPPYVELDNVDNLLGSHLEQSQIKAVHLVEHLASLGYQFTAKQTEPEILAVWLDTPGNPEIVFPLANNASPAKLVSTLQLIVRETKMSDNQVQIDLRFAKPVMRMIPGQVAGASDERVATPSATVH